MKTKNIISLILVLLGNTLLACGISLFLLPCGFVSGGATGMAIVTHHFLGIPISIAVLIFNTFFFVIGCFFLGKHFFVTTLLSTFVYPLCLSIFEHVSIPMDLGRDTLLSALYAGILCGAGLGLVFREGASTGGTDIPVLILNKQMGIPFEIGLYIADGIVILAQAFFTTPIDILYGLLVMMVSSFVIGRVTLIGRTQVQLFIISPKYRDIQTLLMNHLDTGVTLLHIENGLKRTPSQAILTVIPRRKLNEATKLIQREDPTAFITIHEIKEVRGRGYSLER